MTLKTVLRGAPSLLLKVTVVSYSVAAEKELTARRKVLTHTGHPPEETDVILVCEVSFFYAKGRRHCI